MNHILAEVFHHTIPKTDKMKSGVNSGYQIAVITEETPRIILPRFQFHFCHILDGRLGGASHLASVPQVFPSVKWW